MKAPGEIIIESNFSEKSYGTAVCLAGLFGIIGIHHFYLGRWGMGLFDLFLSLTGFTLYLFNSPIGYLLLAIDFIHTFYVTYKLLVGEYKDGYNKIVPYPGQEE